MGIPSVLCRWRVALALAAVGCALFAMSGAVAQSPGSTATGTLDGRLTDWHSVPLERAVVVVRNLVTGETLRGVTGRNGSYRFTGLGPGEYRLEADVPLLGKGAVEGILVAAGHATRVQAALVMELPSPPAEPEVVEEVHELDPVAPAVTTMLPSQELQSAPVSARNWQDFEAITPAANPAAPGGNREWGQMGDEGSLGDGAAGESVSLGGAAASQWTANSIDGIATTPAFRTGSDRPGRLNEDLGESAVLTMEARTGDLPADGGPSAGGVVKLFTAHGRNGLHGQAFYLNRQGLWGARNPFTQWVKETSAAEGIETAQFTPEPYSPADDRQTFGIGMGRHLRRDKAFWFAALDGLRRDDPGVATVRHPASFFARPTDPELQVLAARLNLPSVDPINEAVAAYSKELEGLAGLLGPVPRSLTQIQGFSRVDWQPGERHHLSVEGNAAMLDAPSGALGRTSETYASHSFGNSRAREAWAMGRLESFLSADLLNAFGAQYRSHVQRDTPQTPSSLEAPWMANAWGELPEIVTDSRNGFVLGKPAWLGKGDFPRERSLIAQDTLSWVRGAHLLKAGASFDHVSDTVNTLVNQTGTYSYANVLNFMTDVASFMQYGFSGVGNPFGEQANCDATGRISSSATAPGGLGYFPCYAWYTQRIGPARWSLSSNDLSAFVTEQWQPFANLTISAGMRLETELLPPVIAGVANPDLPATEKLPEAAFNLGPRFGLAWSPWKRTVLRAGGGLYFGRIDNSVLLAALTQTGSPNGDLNFFFKPSDAGAPPFPAVFPTAPRTVVTPGAVSLGDHFRSPEVEQAVLSIEQELPSHWVVSVSALASLGRRLPISVDTNLAPALDASGAPQTVTYSVVDALGLGPIKTPAITVPLYTARTNLAYQQLASVESRANSTYEAGMFKITRYGGHGLTLHAHYLFAHAADWNPNESGQVAGDDVLDPANFRLEYGASNLDIRHSAGATVLYSAPWKLRDWAGYLGNGWTVAAIGQFRSGLPFTMRTGGYIPGFYEPLVTGGYRLLEGVGPGMNGSGGDNRIYGIGRNTYRYPATYTADARLAKRFNLARNRQLEFLAESFNLFNHENVTLIETTGYTIDRGSTTGGRPTFNFLTGLTKAGLPGTVPEFGKPLDVNATNFYRPREFQFGVRARF